MSAQPGGVDVKSARTKASARASLPPGRAVPVRRGAPGAARAVLVDAQLADLVGLGVFSATSPVAAVAMAARISMRPGSRSTDDHRSRRPRLVVRRWRQAAGRRVVLGVAAALGFLEHAATTREWGSGGRHGAPTAVWPAGPGCGDPVPGHRLFEGGAEQRVVAEDGAGGEAPMAEAVVEVVDGLDAHLAAASCRAWVRGDTSGDRAVALDGAGLPASGFEVVDVGGQQLVDRVAGGRAAWVSSSAVSR